MAAIQISDDYRRQLLERLGEGQRLSCKKGCSNCCRHPVLISIFEGLSIYRWLSHNGQWDRRMRDRLREAAEKTHKLALEVWVNSQIACPLLSPEGACTIYPVRPFQCRVTYSVGDPQECKRMGPGMLPRNDLLAALANAERPWLKKHHLGHFRVPLTVAVLYAEQIDRGAMTLEDDAWKAIVQLPL